MAAALARELARAPNASVYIASDDRGAPDALRAQLPDASVYSCKAHCDPALDLRILSLCDRMVGTRASTFSYVAARWGSVPFSEGG